MLRKKGFSGCGLIVTGFLLLGVFSPVIAQIPYPFFDGFESGNYNNWTVGAGTYTRQVTSATAASGTYSFTQIGGNSTHSDGVIGSFSSGQMPTTISFSVRSSSTTSSAAYFVIYGGGGSNYIMGFYMKSTGYLWADGNETVPYQANTWYNIRFELNWTAHTYGYYVNNALIATAISFGNYPITTIYLYNFSPNTAQGWWDNIAIGNVPIDTVNVPHITVSPRSFKIRPADTNVQAMTICNTGIRDTLRYSFDSVAGGRVTEDTASGWVEHGVCKNVKLIFSRAGLVPGNNIFQLRIRHNALLDTNPVSVPCTLVVDSAALPHITVSPGSFRIGPSDTTVRILTICNTGIRDTLQYSIGSNVTPNILAWTYGADLTYRYPNTAAAIRQFIPLANITTTTTTDGATLSTQLQGADVFLIPAQYNAAPSSTIGTAFAPVLDAFARRGGIIIVLYPGYVSTFLTYAGLDTLSYYSYNYSTTATVNVPTDPVFDSIGLSSITMPYYTAYWTGSSAAVRLASYSSYAVCTKRTKGSGIIYLLGADFDVANATWARMLSNCIARNYSGGMVKVDTAPGKRCAAVFSPLTTGMAMWFSQKSA